MAKIDISDGIAQFQDFIATLGADTDKIIMDCLEEAGDATKGFFSSGLSGAIGSNNKYPQKGGTGVLAGSAGAAKPRVNAKGDYDVKIGVSPARPGGSITNTALASMLDKGSSHGIRARPFISKARAAAKSVATATIKSAFEKAMKQ